MTDLRAHRQDLLHALFEASGGRESALDLRRMAHIVEALRLDIPAPAPAFKLALRARLIEEASRRRAPFAGVRQAWLDWNTAMRRSLRVVVAMAMLATLLMGGGALFALAEHTIPGQTLYPLKLARENAGLWFTRGDEPKGLRHLAIAERRVEEVGLLAEAGVREEALYEDALDRLDFHTVKGSELLIKVFKERDDVTVLDKLKSFAEAQSQDLSARLPLLPAGVRANARDSLALLATVDQRANDLLRGCPCPENPLAPATGEPAAQEEGSSPAACRACGAEAPGGGLGPSKSDPPPADEPAPHDPEPSDPGILPIPDTGVEPVDDLVDQLDKEAEELIEDLLGTLPPAAPEPAPSLPEAVEETTDGGNLTSETAADRLPADPSLTPSA